VKLFARFEEDFQFLLRCFWYPWAEVSHTETYSVKKLQLLLHRFYNGTFSSWDALWAIFYFCCRKYIARKNGSRITPKNLWRARLEELTREC